MQKRHASAVGLQIGPRLGIAGIGLEFQMEGLKVHDEINSWDCARKFPETVLLILSHLGHTVLATDMSILNAH